ncbi:MAG: O-antigen ligase family protein [Candidatus Hodarchaeota archaeon]
MAIENLTLLIALFGSFGALFSRPVRAFSIYLAIGFLYPQYLTLDWGTFAFSTSRILIVFVLLNALVRIRLVDKFKLNWLDFFIIATFIGKSLALTFTTDAAKLIERQGGLFFDTILPYLAVRIIVTSREHLISIIKTLLLIGIPLAFIGVYQSLTGNNPYDFILMHKAWLPFQKATELRFGFYRADGPFGIPINFGLFLAAFVPLCLGLRGYLELRRRWLLTGCAFMTVGVLSSMSSAPFFSLLVSGVFILFYRARKHWKLALLFLVVGCLWLEVYSNRHFYQVADRLAYNPRTAVYRIGLIEETFGGGMKDHWFTGHGLVGLGEQNPNTGFDWEHQDLVNVYIGILACFGLIGLIPYLGVNILYYKWLHRAFTTTLYEADRWLIWSFASTMIGWNIALMTVGAFGVNTFLHILIAMISNLPLIVTHSSQSLEATQPYLDRILGYKIP